MVLTTAASTLQGTGAVDKKNEEEERIRRAKENCLNQGGTWDDELKICRLPQPEKPIEPKTEPTKPLVPETFTDPKTGRASGVSLPDGRTFLGLSPSDVNLLTQQQQEIQARPEGTAPVGTTANILEQQQIAQQQAAQVGQFGQLGVSPTGLDFGEAATTGLVSSVPRTLGTIGAAVAGGAAIGAGAGLATGGVLSAPLALVGAGIGFVGGISSAIISNLKSQRTDTTTAQQRVLDEGKQNLNDWATLAAQDPANRGKYISEFNKQLALIDQAYRQMKLDTQRDVAKFETALPNLAEFEAFYSTGGERDALMADMQNAILMSGSNIDYKMLELAQRRGKL